ncbi:uncharacterized protein SAMN05892883_3008 [Jatrophihabitans sp. GAS493]|uniref:DUF1015 family protein n=1 Tax=Jatrophihabitans sp. GAS493 TaxID=1907575 RepID=UPI000BB8377F|nr:DUF1015 domain-containing protein [Jatrophihabitans sp. GAS493]SOD73787.1 uncharacterized protein SAMN05892883_3008 [Jatrophihabitans sp. GAS493]
MTSEPSTLVLHPFRATRPIADGPALASRLCPPYDVISASERARLVEGDSENAVSLILPEAAEGDDPYQRAAQLLNHLVNDGLSAVDVTPTLYVYEMRSQTGETTRGLVGALELRDPELGVVLPHENTMAGPVADRLALMEATNANLEPIYLVYDGGGAASRAVAGVDDDSVLATATTSDGITHRLWGITASAELSAIADDLRPRRALIADGHHRYATYRRMQQLRTSESGSGPWDRGLTLLVDASEYGPQVHAIHRVLRTRGFAEAVADIGTQARVTEFDSAQTALEGAEREAAFAIVLTDGQTYALVTDLAPDVVNAIDEPAELTALDVVVLHRGLVEGIWKLEDNVETVGYEHSVEDAIRAAQAVGGTAVLLRPTPVSAVTQVAASGLRMPRKSTLFTPKPASGLLIRRFIDEYK